MHCTSVLQSTYPLFYVVMVLCQISFYHCQCTQNIDQLTFNRRKTWWVVTYCSLLQFSPIHGILEVIIPRGQHWDANWLCSSCLSNLCKCLWTITLLYHLAHLVFSNYTANRVCLCYSFKMRLEGVLAWVSIAPWSTRHFSPADLPGWLVEPGAHSLLPVFVEVRVQDHSIPAGGHGCLLPYNTAWHTGMSRLSCRHTIGPHSAYVWDAKLAG